jgi:hypothetical protein
MPSVVRLSRLAVTVTASKEFLCSLNGNVLPGSVRSVMMRSG